MSEFVQGRRKAWCLAARFIPWLCAALTGAIVLGVPVVHAQSDAVSPDEEFAKRLRAAQEVTPLKSDLFGDQISLYNGSGEFNTVDIDIPGNGSLPVRLSRRLEVEDRRLPTGHLAGMGDWDLDVPYIDGVFTNEDGWTVIGAGQTQSYARCSAPAQPYTFRPAFQDWVPTVWLWDGYMLHIPGGITEELLVNGESKLPAATDGAAYPWITKSYYHISCLGGTTNGYPGEAFVATSPSGIRYTLNWVVTHADSPVTYSTAGIGAGNVKATDARNRIFMLVTQIADRFGNWVNYNYNGDELQSIVASDGREIDIGWSGGYVQSATAVSSSWGSRTWTYAYANGNLATVTQPDGSTWNYAIQSGSLATARNVDNDPNTPQDHCQLEPDGNTGSFVYSITSPSGAVGTFNFVYTRHYRTYVPLSCVPSTNILTNYPLEYRYFDNFTLTSKQITGAGLGTQTWTYSYADPQAGGYYTASDQYIQTNETYIPPGTCAACATSKVVTVTEPGDVIKYTFGTAYARNEGWLLQTETDGLDGSVKRIESNTYIADAQVPSEPFPDNVGRQIQGSFKNPLVNRIRPVTTTATVQDGSDTYVHQVDSFDAFAKPIQVERYNSIAGQPSITEQTTYFEDLTHWVLGQVQQLYNVSTAETEISNQYDPSTALLTSTSRFGLLQRSFTYNGQGLVATVADGKGNTTTLSNYKGGLPQTIQYADTTSQSLVVDDFGDVRQVTDQAGNTTSYGYDAMGRVSSITYPAGDEQAWYPKNFTYDIVPGAERGISGLHWRVTVATGDRYDVTYYDAMLRPLLKDTYIGSDASSHITTEASFDWKGRRTFAAYPASGADNLGASAGSHTTYDELDRITETDDTSELGTLSTKTAYLSGASRQVTDPKGNITTSSFQVFDQPSEDKVILVQAPEGVNQSVARDLYGNPTAIRQWGNFAGQTADLTKYLIYDAQHRLCRSVEPESGSEVIHYDAANNIDWHALGLSFSDTTSCDQSQVGAAAQIQYTYDVMNRVRQITPPAGTQSTSFGYDVLGNKNSAISGISQWTANRNKLGLITDETLNVVGNGSNRLLYGHDAYGTVRTVTYPDGTAVDYAPDALGRAQQVGSFASGVNYFPDGNIQSFVYGNGTQYLAEENARQLLSNFTYGRSGTLNLSEDFSYDANGNITNINDVASGQRTKSFGYDGLNRLTQAEADNLWGVESYTYDTLNNIQTRTTGGQTYTYAYDATNLLRSINAGGSAINSFNYDVRGNVINKNGNTLAFDALNQLLQIPGFDAYAYDASGRRVQKTPSGSSLPTYYFYNQAGQLLYQYDASTTKITDYIYLGKKLIARNETIQLLPPAAIAFDTNPNNGSYTVSWNAVSNATSYTLQESVNGGAWSTVYSGSGLSLVESNRDGGTYTYRVQSCSAVTCTAWITSEGLGVTPAVPSITVPTTITNGTYTVSWTTSAGATTYDVQEGVNGTWTTIASNITATSISRPGTTTGSYTYQVEAKNSYGARGWAMSTVVTVDTTYGVVPPAPANITVPATSSDGTAAISWAAVSQVTHYILQQSADGGNSWTNAYNGSVTSAALSGLANGTYVYQVQACNNYNCGPWTRSSTLVVTHPPASAPTLSGPTSSNTGSYSLSWTSIATATSYVLQEQVNGGAWATIQSNASTSWSATRGNGTYAYRVEACNAGGCSAFSTTLTVTVIIPPLTPASISAPGSSSGPTTVSWAASNTATSYQLFQSFNGGAWSGVYTGGATGTTINETTTGSYAFEVKACNGGGCSGVVTSGAVAVTIPPANAPGLSVPSTSSNGQYTVTWSAVSGATSYNLQEQVNGGGWTTVLSSGSTSWTPGAKNNGTYGYQVQACNAGGCSGWSGVSSVAVSLSMPISINGQSYWQTYMIPSGTASMGIGFDIANGSTWEVFANKPGAPHTVVASGSIPPFAASVQFTWTEVGVPAGYLDTGGSLTNGAASPVSVGSNPSSTYTTNSFNFRSGSHGRTYQLRVDFFNSVGTNISSSTCQMTADLEGQQS